MQCVNCRQKDAPAYTLRAHVDRAEQAQDGRATIDLEFCSFECLQTWT